MTETLGGHMRSRFEPKKKLKDEKRIKVIDAWQFSVSKSRKLMFIDTTDHHPLKLSLTRKDLKELLDTMDNLI